MEPVAAIMTLFEKRGDSNYGGESVTQLEHALQCAEKAIAEQAPSTLVAAALLHDIGHLLHHLPDEAPDDGIDDEHEVLGQKFLRRHFCDAVTAPVALHVAAKRYLCTVDGDYRSQLSEPSLTSFELQGGSMSPDEVRRFESQPFWKEAVQLRRWDDLAKDPDRITRPLIEIRPFLESAFQQSSDGPGNRGESTDG